MSNADALSYFEAELRRELSKLDAGVLEKLRGSGKRGRDGNHGLVDNLKRDFDRILHRKLTDPVIAELKKRVKRKVLSNLSSIYWERKFR